MILLFDAVAVCMMALWLCVHQAVAAPAAPGAPGAVDAVAAADDVGAAVASQAAVKPVAAGAPQALDPKWRAFLHLFTLQPQPLPGAFRATGKVTFDEEHTQHLAAPLSGRVTQVYVDLGQVVATGTPLLAFAAPEAAALQAEMKKAEQERDVATRSWARARTLRIDGAISDKEAAQIEAAYKNAQVELQRVVTQQKAIGLTAQGGGTHWQLTARQPGTVVQRQVRVGQEVRGETADVLLTISNLDTVWVLADLYEQDLTQVQVQRGDRVQIQVAAYPHESFTGEVVAISEVLDPQSRTLKVRCRVPNAAHHLKPEMFASVIMAHDESMGLVVPTTAVVRQGSQSIVLMVTHDGQSVVERPVRLGPAHGGQQQVLGGLEAGETIITDGALFVHHAMHQG